MLYDNDSRSGAGNLLTFLFGIAIGVAGTMIYAAINEEDFKKAVGKTKSLTGNVQSTVNSYLEDAGDRVKSVTDQAGDAYDGAVSKAKAKATEVAAHVEHAAKRAKKEINS